VRTASDLVAHRPAIEDREIAELLNVSLDDAAWLRQAAHEGT
jgi:orotate phosphoribosyltransferase-like protein